MSGIRISLGIALFTLSLLLAASCSLRPIQPLVSVQVSWPKKSFARGAVSLDEMQDCLFLTALSSGNQSTLSREVLEGLDPAAIGADGTVFGPYTKTQLQTGVSLNIPLAITRLRILGVDGPNCATNPFAANFKKYSVAALYLVGESTADLAGSAKVSIEAKLDASTLNQIANATRTIDGDPRLYLNVNKVLRGKSDVAGSSSVVFNSGPLNPDGSTPFEIRLSDFLDVYKRISRLNIGNSDYHERYDIFISTGGLSASYLSGRYGTLHIQLRGRTFYFDSPGSGICGSSPSGSPVLNFTAALFQLGGWQYETSSILDGDYGTLNLNVLKPSLPYEWSAILTDTPPNMRLSVRTAHYVTPSECTAFTLSNVEAYFEQ